jgi:uncharacterized peroxidase-related enzyme
MKNEETYKMEMQLVQVNQATAIQKELLTVAKQENKMIPNMYKAMANSPALLKTYMDGYKEFRNNSKFTSAEQEVVFLSISVENNCTYCMAAHSLLADMISRVPAAVTEAIRNGSVVPDKKLKALSEFTSIMVNKRGNPSREDVMAFFETGYEEAHILDIIHAISIKTISNYTNHIFHTELDTAFKMREWTGFKQVRNFFNFVRR